MGKINKINKWQQGMVKLSAEGICLPLGRDKKMCPGHSAAKKTFHLLCEIRKWPSKNSRSPRCLMVTLEDLQKNIYVIVVSSAIVGHIPSDRSNILILIPQRELVIF